MHCSNCGSELQQGAVVCNSCGSGVVRVAARTSSVRRCPRCGYWGGGVKYFSRLGHLAVLAGLSLFTYTIGGLTYWLVCRKRLVCPNCGFGWENSTRMLEAPKGASSTTPTTVMTADAGAALMQSDEVLPSKGLGRRVAGVGAILMATLMILIGIVEFEAAPIVVGGVLGMGGSLNFLWGWKALQERRKAVMRGLERRILKLARARGGALTVTDVAAELDLSLEAAEKLLNEMEDGFRIISDVTDAGIIVYEFPEVQHRPQLPQSGAGKEAPTKPAKPA
jgi:hypothetical protein